MDGDMEMCKKKAALVCCSNGLAEEEKDVIGRLRERLLAWNLESVESDYLYAREACFSGTGAERAESVMNFFNDPEIKVIFDVSGGDIANEILPFLNYSVLAASEAVFCGYSDLTTVMNAIYAETGKPSIWYQAKNLVGKQAENQCRMFSTKEWFDLSYRFLQGSRMKGILVGGNIRCLLKLAGTPYWPDMKGKLLFLEARSGSQAQMTAYLNQLKQMGVFEQIEGILLGTFLQLEKEARNSPEAFLSMVELTKRCVGERLPIVQTKDVGHRSDSKALWIGKEYSFSEMT